MKRLSPAAYVGAVLLLIVTVLGFSGLYVGINDPYWIWRQEPPWYREGRGYNRVLDKKERFAKAIQLVARRPDVIVIGNSRVLRGIDTEGRGTSIWYNAGIPSLRIREADAYIRHALNWKPEATIIFGLDYIMFDSQTPYQPGFDKDVTRRRYLIKAIPISLFTKMAYKDARRVQKSSGDDDGPWTYSGFKVSSQRSREAVESGLEWFNNKRTVITPIEYEVFSGILDMAVHHKVRLIIFLSPVNKRQVDGMKADGEYAAFMEWRKRVSAIARRKGVEFHDFSLDNPFYHDRIAAGSSKYWIDASHYSPVVGDWILRSIGLI
jgi:hypothetical protein